MRDQNCGLMNKEAWKCYWDNEIDGLHGLLDIKNTVDYLKVKNIINELHDIVSRNMEKQGDKK